MNKSRSENRLPHRGAQQSIHLYVSMNSKNESPWNPTRTRSYLLVPEYVTGIDGSGSSATMSAGATTCSDGFSSSSMSAQSGYETRRSARRIGTSKGLSGSPTTSSMSCAGANNSSSGGGSHVNTPRARVRVEGGTKRGRS